MDLHIVRRKILAVMGTTDIMVDVSASLTVTLFNQFFFVYNSTKITETTLDKRLFTARLIQKVSHSNVLQRFKLSFMH